MDEKEMSQMLARLLGRPDLEYQIYKKIFVDTKPQVATRAGGGRSGEQPVRLTPQQQRAILGLTVEAQQHRTLTPYQLYALDHLAMSASRANPPLTPEERARLQRETQARTAAEIGKHLHDIRIVQRYGGNMIWGLSEYERDQIRVRQKWIMLLQKGDWDAYWDDYQRFVERGTFAAYAGITEVMKVCADFLGHLGH
jgi:hypothetical protein